MQESSRNHNHTVSQNAASGTPHSGRVEISVHHYDNPSFQGDGEQSPPPPSYDEVTGPNSAKFSITGPDAAYHRRDPETVQLSVGSSAVTTENTSPNVEQRNLGNTTSSGSQNSRTVGTSAQGRAHNRTAVETNSNVHSTHNDRLHENTPAAQSQNRTSRCFSSIAMHDSGSDHTTSARQNNSVPWGRDGVVVAVDPTDRPVLDTAAMAQYQGGAFTPYSDLWGAPEPERPPVPQPMTVTRPVEPSFGVAIGIFVAIFCCFILPGVITLILACNAHTEKMVRITKISLAISLILGTCMWGWYISTLAD